ncbi:MAG TPA: Ig-like domain-containing protein [Gemmatimonadaceae bacterium]|nr:Ig-like domain-containing protein [Gemmatimonadaceae bacterium]
MKTRLRTGVVAACALVAVVSNCKDALAPTADLSVTLAADGTWPDTLSIAEIATIGAAVRDASGAPILGVDLEWATSDSSVVTIAKEQAANAASDGLTAGLRAVLTSHNAGSATIIARLNRPGFESTELRADVRVDTAGRTNWPAVVTVSRTDTARIELIRADAAALEGATVTWQSSDPFVLNVSGLSGDPFRAQLTPRRSGSAFVTATVTGGRIGRSVIQLPIAAGPLQVTQSPAWPALLSVADSQKVNVQVRDARNRLLTGIPVDWHSTNALTLDVTRSGVTGNIVAFRAGGTELIATVGDPAFQTSELRAIVNVQSLAVSESVAWPQTLTVSDTRQLGVIVRGADNQVRPNPSVQWTSTNTAVFRVDATGTVTAIGAGSADVVASVGTAPYQTAEHRATISVVKIPVADSLPWPDSVTVADTVALPTIVSAGLRVPAALARSGLTAKATLPVHWSSTNTAVFTIDANGTLIAISAGTAQAVATVGEAGFQTSERKQTIKVVPLRLEPAPPWPASVNIDRDSVLRVIVRDAFGRLRSGIAVTWRSSNEAAFSVDPTGKVRGLKSGTGDIIASVGTAPFQTTELRATLRVMVRWSSVTAGWKHTCATASDRTGYCWGSNRFGELGNGDDPTRNSPAPRAIASLFKFDELSAGGEDLYPSGSIGSPKGQPQAHTCGRTGNLLFCWGSELSGQLGDAVGPCSPLVFFDVRCTRSTPFTVRDASSGIRVFHVVTGGRLTCTIDLTGGGSDVSDCWGLVDFGAPFANVPSAGNLPSPASNAGVLAGGSFACSRNGTGSTTWTNDAGASVNSLGAIACVGESDFGQVGTIPSIFGVVKFVQDQNGDPVIFPAGALGLTVTNPAAVAAGGRHACILKSSVQILCWGANGKFQTGSTTADACTGGPCSIRARPVTFAEPLAGLTAGAEHTCALAASGKAYCWGSNSDGQLGRGTIGGQFVAPDSVAGGLRFQSLAAGFAHTCGVTTDGSLYCWGKNDSFQLGDGTLVSQRATPVRILEPQ